jgi:hypothetical protein
LPSRFVMKPRDCCKPANKDESVGVANLERGMYELNIPWACMVPGSRREEWSAVCTVSAYQGWSDVESETFIWVMGRAGQHRVLILSLLFRPVATR